MYCNTNNLMKITVDDNLYFVFTYIKVKVYYNKNNLMKIIQNKLGWAGPHSSFTLGFTINFFYEIWDKVFRNTLKILFIFWGHLPF